MPIIKKKAEFAIVLLIGNKSDLEQKVDDKDVQLFAKENRMKYMKTTVKTGNSVETAFVSLTRMVNAHKH